MKNRNVGFLIIGLAVVIGIIVFIFNTGLRNVIGATCSHGSSCSMYSTLNTQTYISLAIVGLILVIGLFLVFAKEREKIITKMIKQRKKEIDKSKLDKIEKKAVNLLIKENGTMFQADLLEKLEIGKVGMTRLLDKLEAKQIIERKRRGMNNIVILK